MKVAVIGSGIAGLGAAWALSADHAVSLFEASDRVGGHSRTLDVDTPEGSIPVDTGFIVYNELNYPHLTHFFELLGVPTTDSDMSLSVSVQDGSLEYAGRASAMFSSPRAVVDGRLWRVLAGINRFRSEVSALRSGFIPDTITISDYLASRGYSQAFEELYLMPLAAAVWSGSRSDVSRMPARSFMEFVDNHGLVDLKDRPQWRTVTGGSREYVERVSKEITSVHTGRGVARLERRPDGVTVVDVSGRVEVFDEVVVATHADTALQLLGSAATDTERNVLGSFRYQANEVVLHTDASVMPVTTRTWSSWNVMERTKDDGSHPVAVTYWMNRLQNLPTSKNVFVTLNPEGRVSPEEVIDTWVAMHPQFDVTTRRAQEAFPTIQGVDRVWFAGAHLGHGFHEDGLQSGLTVAAALDSPVPWWADVTPVSPAAHHAAPLEPGVAR